MRLVIDIPEEIYERFGYEYREESLISKHTNDIILNAFCNGTPLPKGHGRLVDADAVLEEPIGNTYKDIDIAETIIEADKESEDEK